MRRLQVVCLLACLLISAAAPPAAAYLKLGATVGDGRTVALRWAQLPVRYFVNERSVPGVSAAQLQSAVERAFQTWQNLPSSAIDYQFVGFTSAEPFDEDGIVTLGFQDRPELEGILGTTGFVVDTVTGAVVEAGILFNSVFAWSVSPAGESGQFDLQSIALHEIGHLSGLGHSLLGETELVSGHRRVIAAESVMFPFAFSPGSIEGRALRADDIAGISDLYPSGPFSARTGSLSGRVMKDDRGIFGAHVVAFNTRTGALVGGFSLTSSGDFAIAGLDPGPTLLRVEPLDDAPVDSFFDEPPPVDVAFGVTYLERLTMVPSGGSANPVEIRVRER
jgi:hypothetical protein